MISIMMTRKENGTMRVCSSAGYKRRLKSGSLMRPQKGQRRKTPMVETFTLKVRQVEFVDDQSRCNMRGELRMAFDRRKPSSAASVIRNRVRFTEAESEVRIVFEKERRDVIVMDQKQNVGSCFSEPFADWLIGLKNGAQFGSDCFCVSSMVGVWEVAQKVQERSD
jgi:hypothetical protein